MLNCPLCNSSSYFILREFELETLRSKWLKSFGFDPFKGQKINKTFQKLQCLNCEITYFNPAYFGEEDFYETISNNDWYYEKNKWEFDVIINELSKVKPNSLLEFGCGEGNFLQKIHYAIPNVLGTEINNKAITVCRNKGLKVINTDLKNINEKFDVLVSFQVFEHIDRIKFFIEECINKLNREGYLIISVPNPDGYFKELDMNLLDMPPHHNLGWKKNTFHFVENKYGLKLIKYYREPLRMIHYQGYINEITNYNKYLIGNSIKINVIHRLKKMLTELLIPHFYLNNRDKLIGQSHIAIFQKL